MPAKKMKSLEDLFVEQLKDLYSAEKQLVKALPKMAKAATSEDLRQGLEQHLEVTKRQAERLEQIFSNGEVSGTPRGKKCVGMEGIISEGEETLAMPMEPDVKDAALIASAQKAEHYEIATYGTVRTFADTLGKKHTARLLQQTLEEEANTNEKLTAIAENHINRQAKR
jgi:ferritin-like metal-binding protein YciE